jgi:hypothetical protein
MSDLNQSVQDFLAELEARKGRLDSREATLDQRESEIARGEDRLAADRRQLELDRKAIAEVKDLVELKTQVDLSRAALAQLELDAKREERRLASWENRLFQIKSDQDSQSQALSTRETAVTEKEKGWRKEAQDKFIKELTRKLFPE